VVGGGGDQVILVEMGVWCIYGSGGEGPSGRLGGGVSGLCYGGPQVGREEEPASNSQ